MVSISAPSSNYCPIGDARFFQQNGTIPKAVFALFLSSPTFFNGPLKLGSPIGDKEERDKPDLLSQVRLNQRDLDENNLHHFCDLLIGNASLIGSSDAVALVYSVDVGPAKDSRCRLKPVITSSFVNRFEKHKNARFCSIDDVTKLYELFVSTTESSNQTACCQKNSHSVPNLLLPC